jgi:hypothetical protein
LKNNHPFALYTLLIIILQLSCNHLQNELLIENPQPEPVQYYRNGSFDESFFTDKHYCYGDSVNGQPVKYFYTAEVIAMEGKRKILLRNCQASLADEGVVLVFTDVPVSQSMFGLAITQSAGKFSAEYYQTFGITDSSYQPPVYNIIDQHILVDKKTYRKGDSLKAKLLINVLASYSWGAVYSDTIHVYGLVKTVVN